MQCVACNEISLCKTKSIENTKEDKYPCGAKEKVPNDLEVKNNNLFLYEVEA
jgi:hypothetical protein